MWSLRVMGSVIGQSPESWVTVERLTDVYKPVISNAGLVWCNTYGYLLYWKIKLSIKKGKSPLK